MFSLLIAIAILTVAAGVIPATPGAAKATLPWLFARGGRSFSPARSPWPRPTMRSQHWTVRYALLAYVTLWVLALAVALVLGFVGRSAPFGVGALIVEA